MDPLEIDTDEPLEVPNIVHSSYDLDSPKSNSCSTSQVLGGSLTLKEEEMMDPLEVETDESLVVQNFDHSSYDLDAPKSSSRSSIQLLVGSFTLKEEEIVDPLQIENDEPMKVSNIPHLSCGSDTLSSSCNSSHVLVGSLTLKEEGNMDPSQIKNDEPMKVSNLSHSSIGFDTLNSSSCNSSQARVGSFTLKEEGSFRNGRSQKKRSRLVKDLSNTGETIWLPSVSNQSKQGEKIYLKTTVEIEQLTKRTIEENCCGRWRCSACGKIENSFYFLQLHKSTNCETGSSFNCEVCRKKIDNYSDFAIHYIEHEADKKKKCPICLCPNVNNMKEHVIVENHLSGDINGFIFTGNECKKSSEKAKQEVFYNSTIDGYCQDFKVGFLSRKSEKKVKKEYLSVVQSIPDVQEKPNLRQRKENTIYVESSDSDIDVISDEEMDIFSEEAYEVMSSDESDPEKILGMMPPKSSISHTKNRSSGKRLSQPEEVALKSFGSRWNKMSLSFKEKLDIESSENTHICKLCNESFSLLISLSIHMRGHDEIEIQQCQFYRSKFKKKHNIDYRFETQNGTRDSFYECTICKRTFIIRRSFTNHMRWHRKLLRAMALNDESASDPVSTDHRGLTYDNLNKCATCGSTYKYRGGLLRHLRCNPEHRETHFCNIHDKTFSPDLLFQPQTETYKSNNENEMFQCPFCQTRFKEERHLCSHLVAHRDKTCNLCIRCNMCTSSFSLPSELLNHLKMHEKTKATEKTEIASATFCANLLVAVQPSENSDAKPPSNSEPVANNIVRESNFNECGICKKTYIKRKSLLGHLRKHSELRKRLSVKDKPSKLKEISHPYECASCGKRFKDRKYFLRHLRTQHKQTENGNEDEVHQCPFCQTNFEKKYHLCRHLMTHKNGGELRCNKCSESFSWPFELVTHMEMHKKTEMACSVQPSENSDDEPTSNSELITNNIVGESNFNECGICKKTYVNRRSLLRHLRRHVEGRKYLCYICGLGFFRDIDLRMHIQRHTGDKNFTCDKCGKSLYSMSLLNQHLKKHAIEESGQRPEKIFGCEICNTKFETKIGYSLHMKKHNEGATHECGFCQRKFYTSYRLTEHKRTHTGEKPYECKICSNSFAQKQGLNSHMKTHSDKRPYSCELCTKTFKKKSTKNDHVNTHTGNRPHKCKQCDMCFGSRKVLKKHKRVHTRNPEEKKFREKKFSCNICSEVFAVSAYRDKHVALHENPSPFSCEFCSKSFNYKKNMVAHVQRCHPSCNPFRCKLCSKTYDTIRKIDVHINSRACVKINKSHKKSKNQGKSTEVAGNTNAENLFICNVCNGDFMSAEEIQDHFNASHKPS
ncbi:zinc finger protein 845-like [Artemia franciscana]|uniref:C2H2-type domain-containing protein n=1 Tax=Artemia franciscana TaxID=6661 RepID=A0AA88HMB8_ARTSF|nr:hypothetical protein QYM36_014068 [Artemia franciscana]